MEKEEIRIAIPERAQEVLSCLRSAGFEAYIVGGCVRDAILGRTPGDWDITTSALPADVKRIFRRTVDTGIQHGTVTVLIGKEGFEVTTYRIDGAYEDGRHPESVTFTRSLAEDLKRRDFTINAMAYSGETGLIDLFDGLGDMERKCIRCVGDPMERFSEDALRIMRAMRFSAQLGYEIEENTLKAARTLAANLDMVSAERIRVELEKLLVSDHPEKILMCQENGILQRFLPEFTPCMDCMQNNPHHGDTVAAHTVKSLTASRKDRVIRLSVLFHDIGKPQTKVTDENGIDSFPGHAEKSSEMADRILRRLKYDNDTRKQVTKLVRLHSVKPELTDEAVRRAAVAAGPDSFENLLDVCRADAMGQTKEWCARKLARIEKIEAIWQGIVSRGDCLDLRHLAVKGADLIERGVRPGKDLGEILKACLDDVLTDPSHNTREYLLDTWGSGKKPEKPEKQE